jgi:tRNA (guanosine-2'-O-)-methyltransferase
MITDPEIVAYFLKHLKEIILPERWQRFEQILDQRTRHLTVVLEDIYQPHNASAVLRTCECMGVQDLHVIENENEYNVNPDIVVGSSKWITIKKYNKKKKNNTLICFRKLKEQGYRIVATSPHKDDCLIHELPIDQKTALVFGNEGKGLSDVAMKNADAFVRIPMFGFTESFNISVSAALCMYELLPRIRQSDLSWRLSDNERDILMVDFAMKSIRNPMIFKRKKMKELGMEIR